MSLAEILRRLRQGAVSSLALTRAAIERHEKYGGLLNAYRTFAPEAALARAGVADKAFAEGRDLGPLQGVPISVKDLFGVDCRRNGSRKGRSSLAFRRSSASSLARATPSNSPSAASAPIVTTDRPTIPGTPAASASAAVRAQARA
jgi:hypothetical protein